MAGPCSRLAARPVGMQGRPCAQCHCQRQAGCSAARRRWQCPAATALTVGARCQCGGRRGRTPKQPSCNGSLALPGPVSLPLRLAVSPGPGTARAALALRVVTSSCSERPRAAPAAAVRGTGRMLMPLNHDNDPGLVIPPAVGSTTSWRWMMTPAWLCRIDSVMPAPDNMIQVFTIL